MNEPGPDAVPPPTWIILPVTQLDAYLQFRPEHVNRRQINALVD